MNFRTHTHATLPNKINCDQSDPCILQTKSYHISKRQRTRNRAGSEKERSNDRAAIHSMFVTINRHIQFIMEIIFNSIITLYSAFSFDTILILNVLKSCSTSTESSNSNIGLQFALQAINASMTRKSHRCVSLNGTKCAENYYEI